MDIIDQRDEILRTFLEYGIRENEVDGLRKTDLVECAEAIVKKMSVMRCCESDSEQLVCNCNDEDWVYDQSGVDMYCSKCEPK